MTVFMRNNSEKESPQRKTCQKGADTGSAERPISSSLCLDFQSSQLISLITKASSSRSFPISLIVIAIDHSLIKDFAYMILNLILMRARNNLSTLHLYVHREILDLFLAFF